jgi:hypothetical protein
MLPIGDEPTGEERLAAVGLETRVEDDGRVFVDFVAFASIASRAGIDFDQEIVNLQVPTHPPPKEIVYIPTMALLVLVWLVQSRRRKREQEKLVSA